MTSFSPHTSKKSIKGLYYTAMDVYEWKEIEDKFKEGIVLGNGSSIAIDRRFSYSSLFQHAEENGLLTGNVGKIFDHLRTQDFELVLRMLWHAHHINRALKIDDSVTSRAYEDLRNALICSIKDIHVEYKDVADLLLTIANFLKHFKTVVSLNYDFLVYWSMLVGNTEWSKQWFKDCFINLIFVDDWEYLRKPHDNAGGSTLVFYPHGNLVIAADLFGRETKIVTNELDPLMDTVVDKWESGKFSPLFVSEGTSNQKLNAINRSPYLKNVSESVLPKLGSCIVIFGWSIGDQDAHILNALCKNEDLTDIAVSVRKSDGIEDKCDCIGKRIREATKSRSIKVVFFNAASNGCWANP